MDIENLLNHEYSSCHYNVNDETKICGEIFDGEISMFVGSYEHEIGADYVSFLPINAENRDMIADPTIYDYLMTDKEFNRKLMDKIRGFLEENPEPPRSLSGAKAAHVARDVREKIKEVASQLPTGNHGQDKLLNEDSLYVAFHYMANGKEEIINVPYVNASASLLNTESEARKQHVGNPEMVLSTGIDAMNRSLSKKIRFNDIEAIKMSGKVLYETREHSLNEFRNKLTQTQDKGITL